MNPIPTVYNGVTYRSRLEARWACAFGWLGWDFVYEPEGFEHDGERYLPDFWITELDAFVEIKRTSAPVIDIEMAFDWQQTMDACGQRLVVIQGEPVHGKYDVWMMLPKRTKVTLMDCRKCRGVSYTFENGWGEFGGHTCGNNCEKVPVIDDRVREAMVYAMAEKFGERK